MARLFTFGCSLTNYVWPTWSNVLATHPHFDNFENWAISGVGNFAIFERLVECITTRNLQPDDVVIVQWSGIARHDTLLTSKGWVPQGGLVHSKVFNTEWYNNFFDPTAYSFHTLNYITAAQTLLNNANCIWKMTSMHNLCLDEPDSEHPALPKCDQKWIAYDNIIDRQHWIKSIGFNTEDSKDLHEWYDAEKDSAPWKDWHRTPAQSWMWATTHLLPSLGLKETQEQQKLILEVDTFTRNLKKLNQAYLENTQQFEWFAKQQSNIGYPYST